MLDVIVATLDELISIQKQLIQYADQKRTLLIERKVDDLNQLSQEEAKLLKQLGQLEETRNRQVETLLSEHPAHTFRQYIETIEDNHVKNKLDTLQQLVQELKSKNKLNEQLLKDSLRFVHHMIDQITQSKQQHFNYQSPLQQQKSQTSSQGFFDTKA